MKYRIIVAAVVEKDGKYLFGKKSKDIGPYPNVYHILGGGVDMEHDEGLEDALRRELKEEGNIAVKNIRPLFFDEDKTMDKHGEMTHYFFHIYHVDYKSGQPTPGDDIVGLYWIEKKDIKNIPLGKPSKKLFAYMGWL